MGFICFTIYVNGKIFLINIGLIDKNKMMNQLKFKYRKGVNKLKGNCNLVSSEEKHFLSSLNFFGGNN